MKLTLTKENLGAAVKKCSLISLGNTTLPVLSNIFLEAKKGELILSVTNLESGLIIKSRASVDEAGVVLVPFKTLSGVMNGSGAGTVSLEESEGRLVIVDNKTRAEIKVNSGEEFPLIPKLKKGKETAISPKIFAEAIKMVLPATAISGMKPELASVYVATIGKELKVVATDGFRLIEVSLTRGFDKINPIIIPHKTAQEICKILGGLEDEKVSFYEKDNQLVIEGDSFYWVSRAMEGNYPDYQKIIPQTKNTEIVLNKSDLVEAIKGAAVFSDNETNDIVIDYSKNESNIGISSESQKTGKFLIKIKGKVSGKEGTICLNHRYLMDALNCLDGESVVFWINQETGPVILKTQKNKEDNNVLCLISPIKKNNA